MYAEKAREAASAIKRRHCDGAEKDVAEVKNAPIHDGSLSPSGLDKNGITASESQQQSSNTGLLYLQPRTGNAVSQVIRRARARVRQFIIVDPNIKNGAERRAVSFSISMIRRRWFSSRVKSAKIVPQKHEFTLEKLPAQTPAECRPEQTSVVKSVQYRRQFLHHLHAADPRATRSCRRG